MRMDDSKQALRAMDMCTNAESCDIEAATRCAAGDAASNFADEWVSWLRTARRRGDRALQRRRAADVRAASSRTARRSPLRDAFPARARLDPCRGSVVGVSWECRGSVADVSRRASDG